MDCVNHSGVNATAYCQSCGKGLCANCTRNSTGGQVFCEPCATTWQSYTQPFVATFSGGPNPAAAAVLGLIPGVGAMYNGQFFKGFIHVLVFAILISITSSINGIFGIFIVGEGLVPLGRLRRRRQGEPRRAEQLSANQA